MSSAPGPQDASSASHRDPLDPLDLIPPRDDAVLPGLVRLSLVAAVAGAAAGVVGGLFRLLLERADVRRTAALEWVGEDPWVRGPGAVLLGALLVGLARLLVRWAPEAGGSGVQFVEANIRGEAPEARLRVLPVKFVGGVLAIGSAGLALGREGPTVQMGATIGGWLGRVLRLPERDVRTLHASVAGAGLGVAFSAPLGGAMFVFEEVARAFRTRLVVVTLVASATALAVAQRIVGDRPVFPVPPVEAGPVWTLALFAALGVLLGAAGVAYNALVVASLDVFDRFSRIPPELRAAAIGGFVVLVGIGAPSIIGGGEVLAEKVLVASTSIGVLVLLLALRWFLGPISYAAGTPGGLFAPLLLLGAAAGVLVAEVLNALVPSLALSPLAFGIVGMSTFFAGVVRAPLTGVVLVTEMTATTSLLVPMVLAAAVAELTATKLRGKPIYDTLRERMQRTAPGSRA
ncbi:MAG: ClC family H(+)/Cl(-) exchange transporter [Candidatus Nanopelagicales bacterium]